MDTDSRTIFENFVKSRVSSAEIVEEKKRSRSTNPNADIDKDGKKGTASDKYLANLNKKVTLAIASKKKSEEEEAKARGNRVDVASSKLLGDLNRSYSTDECEQILRKALDTHLTARGHGEAAETVVTPVTGV
jgi:polysaccharide deacetylase 2 family uncharacterized protein YibQ